MKETINPKKQAKSDNEKISSLILINDNYNSFDYVIDCLTALCDHDIIQAEQCALITHNNGRCKIMSSVKSELDPIREDLALYGLNVDIISN